MTMSPDRATHIVPVKIYSNDVYQVPPDSSMWALKVDYKGDELPVPGTKDVYLLPHLKELVEQNAYTDIFICAHGWNTTAREDGSTDFSVDMVRGLIANTPGKQGIKPLYIGITWPSRPVKSLFVGGEGVRTNYHANTVKYRELLAQDPSQFWDDVEKGFEADGDIHVSTMLRQLFNYFDPRNMAPSGEIIEHPSSEIEEIQRLVKDAANVEQAVRSPSELPNGGTSQKSAPKRHGFVVTVPEIARTVQFVRDAANTLGFKRLALAQDRVIYKSRVLEHILFQTFENRARAVGENGVSQVVWELMKASESSGTKFHLFGHSLGSHVVTSAAMAGCPEYGDPSLVYPRKIHSLTLLQGAVPSAFYAETGEYRALGYGRPIVAGPVVATTSRFDLALQTYELFRGKPLGRAGFPAMPNRMRQVTVNAGSTSSLGFEKGLFFTIDANAVIEEQSVSHHIDVAGAHSDIQGPEIMSCIWEAANVKVDGSDYRI
jgi:hypothetical protein